MRLCIFILACLILPAVSLAGPGDRLVHGEIFADVSDIAPGETFHVGVLLKIDPGWHIYWKNPGDSGLATTVKLTLPAGFTGGQVEYPFPSRLVLPGNIVNYAYEDETMLIIPVTASRDVAAGSAVAISAKVNWLVCREACSPGSAAVNLVLPVSTIAAPANSELFQRWSERIPVEHDPENVADISSEINLNQAAAGLAGSGVITIQWKRVPSDIQWFPAPASTIIVSDINVSTVKNSTAITYHVDVSSDAGNIREMESVVVYTIPGGQRMALVIRGHGK